MNTITDFVDLLCKQIEKINKKGDITPDELTRMDKAIDIVKDCSVICAMEEYGKDPEEEGSHEMGLTQVPILVVPREEVVIHGGDGLQREVAAEKGLVVALPG